MIRISRRILCLAMAALMLATLLPAALSGGSARAEDTLGVVTKEEVAFRVNASMRAKMHFRLRINTVCKVVGSSTAEGYTWSKIEAQDPDRGSKAPVVTGYIRGDCFRLMGADESSSYSGTVPESTVDGSTAASGTSRLYRRLCFNIIDISVCLVF